MSNPEASIATRRFGLGPKPGDLKRIASDPRGYVLAALAKTDGALITDAGLSPAMPISRAIRERGKRSRRRARPQRGGQGVAGRGQAVAR